MATKKSCTEKEPCWVTLSLLDIIDYLNKTCLGSGLEQKIPLFVVKENKIRTFPGWRIGSWLAWRSLETSLGSAGILDGHSGRNRNVEPTRLRWYSTRIVHWHLWTRWAWNDLSIDLCWKSGLEPIVFDFSNWESSPLKKSLKWIFNMFLNTLNCIELLSFTTHYTAGSRFKPRQLGGNAKAGFCSCIGKIFLFLRGGWGGCSERSVLEQMTAGSWFAL